ncbi:MAG: GNAT family N-acetyltransferase [Burkholderiales bacterium]
MEHRHEPSAPQGSAAGKAPAWARWIPIRNLGVRHRNRIERHLLTLDARDRYLRFGYPASDDQLRAYVAGLDFNRDEIFGIFNRRLQLVATAHVAYGMSSADHPPVTRPTGDAIVEFAVSVLESARGRHYGSRLFAHAVMHARNRGVHRLFIHALSENKAMLRIARNAGARVVQDGSESEAWLQLPPDHWGTHIEEVLSRQASELNYGVKVQAFRWSRWLDLSHWLKHH